MAMPVESAKMPKNTPVTSSQSTPERRTTGSTVESRKRVMPSFTRRTVGALVPAVRTADRAARFAEGAGSVARRCSFGGEVGFTTVAGWVRGAEEAIGAEEFATVAVDAEREAGVGPDGFSARAASTALRTVFAACRAPNPSARPKRTASMREV